MSAAEADFVIIGGLAMTVHGSDYVTTDVHFAYRRTRQNVDRIASALAPIHPRPEGWEPTLPFVWDGTTIYRSSVLTLETDSGSVDLLGEVAGIDSYRALEENAVEITLFGWRVKVASLGDLIKMKEAANRTKDRLHLLELRALKENESAGREKHYPRPSSTSVPQVPSIRAIQLERKPLPHDLPIRKLRKIKLLA